MYYSSFQSGWICKVCEEHLETGDQYWKTKTQVHDHHPTEMFNNHLYSHKHKQSLVTNQNIKAMLSKGNIKAQITTAIKSSSVETKESN